MSRKEPTPEEKEKIEQLSRRFGDIILRGSRAYLAAVRAPSRAENQQAEERFFAALSELFIAIGESRFLD